MPSDILEMVMNFSAASVKLRNPWYDLEVKILPCGGTTKVRFSNVEGTDIWFLVT